MKPLPAIIISVLAAATLGACGPSSDTKSPDGKTTSKDSGKVMDMSKGDMKGMDMKGVASDKKADGQVHKATGKVTKVDRAAATVTIDHGPVASMNWPSMSMAFKVKDPAMLEKIKQGAQVEFSFAQSGKDHVITDIK